jgi:hypothetical protein
MKGRAVDRESAYVWIAEQSKPPTARQIADRIGCCLDVAQRILIDVRHEVREIPLPRYCQPQAPQRIRFLLEDAFPSDYAPIL